MRYPAKVTEERHAQLVEKTSSMIRERGVDGVSVGDAMKAAGLTHGAFYSHFGSKTELVCAAIAYGMDSTRNGLGEDCRSPEAKKAYIDRYLSMRHRDQTGGGCTMSSLCGELRDKPELKGTFTGKFEEVLLAMGGDREQDLATIASLVGAISLARAINDEGLALELLEAVKKQVLTKDPPEKALPDREKATL